VSWLIRTNLGVCALELKNPAFAIKHIASRNRMVKPQRRLNEGFATIDVAWIEAEGAPESQANLTLIDTG
jgi:hypothetical protein